MTTPRQKWNPNPDREKEKRNAIRLAARAAQRSDVAETSKRNALAFALDHGASLRELEEATGVPRMSIKRIADQQKIAAEGS